MPTREGPNPDVTDASARTPFDGTREESERGKTALRTRLLAERRRIGDGRLRTAGRTLAVHLRDSVLPVVPHDRSCIPIAAAFSSIRGEVPMDDLLRTLLDRGYRVLIPKLGAGMEVGWGRMDAPADLNRRETIGGWRPDEPEGASLPAESLSGADLILVPALSIDLRGTRLGRGGGWYDRALTKREPGALVVGICWEDELTADPLPRQPHDLPVDAVLTPGGFTLIAAGRSHQGPSGS